VQRPLGPCNATTTDAPHGDVGRGTVCFNGEAGASNWPHRGGKHSRCSMTAVRPSSHGPAIVRPCHIGKYSLFEGGIRVNAFVAGGFLPAAVRGTRLEAMVHVVDWCACNRSYARAYCYDT
jgi:arylsulfatase A-like enzyme